MRRDVARFALSLALMLAGCAESGTQPDTPDAQVSPTDGGVVSGNLDGGFLPDPTLTEVPANLDVLTTTSTCTSLGDGETVWSVSPDGYLWTGTSTLASTIFRVRDGWNEEDLRQYSLPFSTVNQLIAQTATVATVVADGRLWVLEDGVRVLIKLPVPPMANATGCGDLRTRGFMLSGNALYERIDDTWFQWSGLDDVLTNEATLLSRNGACRGTDDEVWLTAGSLATWALTPTQVVRTGTIAGGQQPTIRDDQLLMIRDGELLGGPRTWRRWSFDGGDATLLAAAGSYAWLVVGSDLVRFDGSQFFRVETPGATASRLLPHASGGLWYQAGNQVCHVTPTAMLRVDKRPAGEVQEDEQLVLRARPTDEAATVTAELDGVALTATGVDDGWWTFSESLTLGWHEVEVAVAPGSVVRRLQIKRAPGVERSFETDVLPIYNAHCANAACHAPNSTSGAPDLGQYEAWLIRTAAVHKRVVEDQNMPPPASRGPEWNEDFVRIINEWLSGGLKP